ncbi:MAG TPA: MarR family transcriptional regulator [Rhodobacteraceae bacterium]|nr:MarR family transcriptional regulator [Paracoccaceae bacterium]
MPNADIFDLASFLPYLLNRAAEESSVEFARIYKDNYGLLRTEWRVLFHLGQHGELTATDIGRISRLHKTKISRAVAGLQKRRYLRKTTSAEDRRREFLKLTDLGVKVFEALSEEAQSYNQRLLARFSPKEQEALLYSLKKLGG